MAGKKTTRILPSDPRDDLDYMKLVESFRGKLSKWKSKRNLTVAEISRRSGVSRTAISKILEDGNDWSKRTMAPKFWTMYRLSRPAGIRISFSQRAERDRTRTEYLPLRQPKLPRRRR